jgi:SAM-dependent methyltransferase
MPRSSPPSAASRWVQLHEPLLPRGGHILDLACGSGRHTSYLAQLGHQLTALDRDLRGIEDLQGIDKVQHDLEQQAWPFAQAMFDGIIVTNYLHRPLFPVLAHALAPGGILIYETFMRGNEFYGRPTNPDYLLRTGELRAVFGALLQEVAYAEALDLQPLPAVRQRVVMRKPDVTAGLPA